MFAILWSIFVICFLVTNTSNKKSSQFVEFLMVIVTLCFLCTFFYAIANTHKHILFQKDFGNYSIIKYQETMDSSARLFFAPWDKRDMYFMKTKELGLVEISSDEAMKRISKK
jgi:bacteriorhodopsin